MADTSRLAVFLRDTLKLPHLLARFHDIRQYPRIPLPTILTAVFLMPFWGKTALLRLDTLLRRPEMLTFFHAPKQKRVVVSDTTIARVLTWLNPQESREALLALLPTLEQEQLLKRPLGPNGRLRRMCAVDGSQMSAHHYLVAALLCGESNYPALVEPCASRGQELTTAQQIIAGIPADFGSARPELYLLDGLYFNGSTFTLIRDQQAHLLIKYTVHEKKDEQERAQNKLFRDVLEDAKQLFEHSSPAVEPPDRATGFDAARCCEWSMKRVPLEFAGYPIQVCFLVEDYPKRKKNPHVETWIVTTDLSLSFEEAREAGHLRWQIENNEFKRLSHLAGTKRFYFKDPRPFFAMLRLFCLSVAVFGAFFSILYRSRQELKSLLNGCKFTWLNAFSMIGCFDGAALTVLVVPAGG